VTIDNHSGPGGAVVRVVLVLAEGQRAVVGRSSDAEIRCDTGACSRKHCALGVADGALYLEDLGSSNGTWINGQKVKRQNLSEGDRIHAGQPRLDVVAVERL
jgi:pSer/pThr/pTyr-binding forkhead associated (FHA) protein